MATLTETLTHEHTDCDTWFAQAEADVAAARWEPAVLEFTRFAQAMEAHFTREERVLFPAFEERTGHTSGPTYVMRMEHQQMRGLFADMQDSLAQRDRDTYLGLSETLLALMRQHNMKEEQILYPMSDQVLADSLPELLQRMRQTA